MMADGEGSMRIGSYTIIGPLGNGGTGNVSLARSDKDGQLVALKRLGKSEAYGWAQLRRGAMAVQRLDHDAIAKIYGWGEDGKFYYVVGEYVDGKDFQEVFAAIAGTCDPHFTLDALWKTDGTGDRPAREEFGESLDEDAPDDDEIAAPITPQAQHFIASGEYINACCKLVMQVALALDHAHERSVIHRDIKPGNLMITRDCRVKIIDFGVARYDDDATITRTGKIIGTPAYMSPEQIKGDAPIKGQSDIFSLGIVLYEALTLDRPHAASTAFGIMAQIANRQIKPIRWKNGNIPESLASIVHKATALSLADRYDSAKAMADDLKRHLEGQPVTARTYRYALDMREIASRRPLRVLLSAVFYFFQATLLALMCPGVLIAPLPAGITWPIKLLSTSLFAACGLTYFILGRGILAARIPAMIISPIVSLVTVGLFGFTEYIELSMGDYNAFNLLMLSLLVFFGAYIFISVISPKTITWIKASQAIRDSYRKPPDAQGG